MRCSLRLFSELCFSGVSDQLTQVRSLSQKTGSDVPIIRVFMYSSGPLVSKEPNSRSDAIVVLVSIFIAHNIRVSDQPRCTFVCASFGKPTFLVVWLTRF